MQHTGQLIEQFKPRCPIRAGLKSVKSKKLPMHCFLSQLVSYIIKCITGSLTKKVRGNQLHPFVHKTLHLLLNEFQRLDERGCIREGCLNACSLVYRVGVR